MDVGVLAGAIAALAGVFPMKGRSLRIARRAILLTLMALTTTSSVSCVRPEPYLTEQSYVFSRPLTQKEIDNLIRRLGDKDDISRQDALYSLVAVGPPAIPALTEALEEELRRVIADEFIKALHDDAIRHRIAERRGRMEYEKAIRPLIKAAKKAEDHFLFTSSCIGVCDRLGSVAKDAVPSLIDIL